MQFLMFLAVDLSWEGLGQVMFAVRVDLQCILMFSYKYYSLVRSISKPGMYFFGLSLLSTRSMHWP